MHHNYGNIHASLRCVAAHAPGQSGAAGQRCPRRNSLWYRVSVASNAPVLHRSRVFTQNSSTQFPRHQPPQTARLRTARALIGFALAHAAAAALPHCAWLPKEQWPLIFFSKAQSRAPVAIAVPTRIALVGGKRCPNATAVIRRSDVDATSLNEKCQ